MSQSHPAPAKLGKALPWGLFWMILGVGLMVWLAYPQEVDWRGMALGWLIGTVIFGVQYGVVRALLNWK